MASASIGKRIIVSRLLLAGLAAASLVGGSSPIRAQAAARTFDPVVFFSGSTEGHGTVDEVLASPRKMHVTSSGALGASGVFVLNQTVRVEGDPVQKRQWQLRQTAPGRFSGTLSDASGPVTGVVTGHRMRISYKMKGGLKVEQMLTLASDGRSAANSMKVRKLGIVVATIVETIRKI